MLGFGHSSRRNRRRLLAGIALTQDLFGTNGVAGASGSCRSRPPGCRQGCIVLNLLCVRSTVAEMRTIVNPPTVPPELADVPAPAGMPGERSAVLTHGAGGSWHEAWLCHSREQLGPRQETPHDGVRSARREGSTLLRRARGATISRSANRSGLKTPADWTAAIVEISGTSQPFCPSRSIDNPVT